MHELYHAIIIKVTKTWMVAMFCSDDVRKLHHLGFATHTHTHTHTNNALTFWDFSLYILGPLLISTATFSCISIVFFTVAIIMEGIVQM
jgi:hypothetical protein